MGGARGRRLRRDDEPAARPPRGARRDASRSRRSRSSTRRASARRHRQGALPHRRRPPGRGGADALPRRPPLDLRLLAVGLPAHLHVLRHRRDALRPQPARLGDPRPGAALPPARAGEPSRVHGDGRAVPQRRRGARRGAAPAGDRDHAPADDDLDRGLDAGSARGSSTRSSSRSGSRSRSTQPIRGCAPS